MNFTKLWLLDWGVWGLPSEATSAAGPKATYKKGNKERSTRHLILVSCRLPQIKFDKALQDSDHEDMDVLSNAGARPGRQGSRAGLQRILGSCFGV